MATVLGKGSAKPGITDKLLFITTWSCPYAQRTWIALNESGLPYEAVFVDLQNKPEWLFEYNPLGKVPTIVKKKEDGTLQHAYESLILNEMIGEMVSPKLLPLAPFERANVRIMTDTLANKVLSPFMKLMFAKGEDATAEALEAANKEIKWLADNIKGPFIFGEEFTLADVAVAPWILRMPVFENLKGVKLGGEGIDRVNKYRKALLDRASVKGSIKPPSDEGDYVQQLTDVYKAYIASRS